MMMTSLTDGWLLGFPDPFAVATVGGEQTHTTSVIKKTLNPYWNEMFDLYGRPFDDVSLLAGRWF